MVKNKQNKTNFSAKLSPTNSMSGLKANGKNGGGDPTNHSVVEENHFKDNDSLQNNHNNKGRR